MIPTSVECVILGTGLTNSILAAACSRIGKSVLHVDKNNFYGDEWASFTFQQFLDWIKDNRPNDPSLENVPEELLKASRMFCIDLCPKLVYSNGAMVDLLVKSNVSRYHEFKNTIRILSRVDEEIHVLPCRRNEVFTSSLIKNLVDKRRLMKFIESCLQDSSDPRDQPIGQYLESQGLERTLREFIINSIAMVSPEDSLAKTCERVKRIMAATERFGRSPFLFPLYGCGEFPQSFCRLSAVFGGTYCLNTKVEDVSIGESEFCVKLSNNTEPVRSGILIADQRSAKELKLLADNHSDVKKVSRAILITNESMLPNPEKLVSFLRIPPDVFFLEVNSSVMVSPPGMNLLYLWSQTAKDLRPLVDTIFKTNPSAIMWSHYYQQEVESPLIGSATKGLYVTGSPCNDIDYELCIEEAERTFHKLFPDDDFLPRAPDPEEIITDSDFDQPS